MKKLLFILLLIPSLVFGADYYDYQTRTDRDGKAAGLSMGGGTIRY